MKANFLIPVFVFLVGCNNGNKPFTESQKEAVKAEATIVVKDFFNALATNDTAKMNALGLKSPDFTFINSSGVLNYEDVSQLIKQLGGAIEKQTFETKSEKYLIIDPTCFIYTWIGKNGVTMKSGESTMLDDFMASYTYKKTGGVWKMICGHESSKLPELADPVSEFTKIETDWNSAIMNKDAKALDLLYAKEYSYTDISGTVFDKLQDIKEITSNSYKLTAPSVVSDIKARTYGDIAVVKGLNSVKALVNGKNVSGTYRFTDIFLMRDGRWQCISTEAIRLTGK